MKALLEFTGKAYLDDIILINNKQNCIYKLVDPQTDDFVFISGLKCEIEPSNYVSVSIIYKNGAGTPFPFVSSIKLVKELSA